MRNGHNIFQPYFKWRATSTYVIKLADDTHQQESNDVLPDMRESFNSLALTTDGKNYNGRSTNREPRDTAMNGGRYSGPTSTCTLVPNHGFPLQLPPPSAAIKTKDERKGEHH